MAWFHLLSYELVTWQPFTLPAVAVALQERPEPRTPYHAAACTLPKSCPMFTCALTSGVSTSAMTQKSSPKITASPRTEPVPLLLARFVVSFTSMQRIDSIFPTSELWSTSPSLRYCFQVSKVGSLLIPLNPFVEMRPI